MKYIYLLILFLSSFTEVNAKNDEETYLVNTKDFKVENFSLKQIGLGITAVIYNPYKAKVTIDEILIDVFIGDKKLGTITEADDKIKIKKESAFDLPLNIDVKTGATVTKFFTEGTKMILMGKKIRVDYKGYIKVKALGFIPVKVKIDQYEYFTLKDIMSSPEKQNTNTPTNTQQDANK